MCKLMTTTILRLFRADIGTLAEYASYSLGDVSFPLFTSFLRQFAYIISFCYCCFLNAFVKFIAVHVLSLLSLELFFYIKLL